MRIQSRFWMGIAASFTVSAVIGVMAFSIFRGINEEFTRGQQYNALIIKALNLNSLIESFRAEPSRRVAQQANDVRAALVALLSGASSREPGEEAILAQLRRNSHDAGRLLEQFSSRDKSSDIEVESRNMLAAQLVIKVRFIADDADRLLGVSRQRVETAQRDLFQVAGLCIGLLIVTNAAIAYAFNRRVVESAVRLAGGARQVAEGDLDHKVEIGGADELADLASVFNTMVDALKTHTRKLEQSNRELQDFAFIASHDLQEPLRKIQAFGGLLREEAGERLAGEPLHYLSRMENAATRMRQLIDALLEYSRIAGRQKPFEPVDLNQAVSDVVTDLEANIAQTGAVIEVGPLPTIEAEPVQMRQLLQNLISNALKYHRANERPVVRVHARRRDDESGGPVCELTVSDNGIGFDEAFLEKVFTPFQRLHSRDEYPGTGMGLAICRRIAERHGGSITATSRTGEGSDFIVTLPERHGRSSLPPQAGSHKPQPAGAGPGKEAASRL